LHVDFDNFNLIPLGKDKEFEDEFSCEQLYNCFETELNLSGITSIEDLEIEK
jgi:hypothetical protein